MLVVRIVHRLPVTSAETRRDAADTLARPRPRRTTPVPTFARCILELSINGNSHSRTDRYSRRDINNIQHKSSSRLQSAVRLLYQTDSFDGLAFLVRIHPTTSRYHRPPVGLSPGRDDSNPPQWTTVSTLSLPVQRAMNPMSSIMSGLSRKRSRYLSTDLTILPERR